MRVASVTQIRIPDAAAGGSSVLQTLPRLSPAEAVQVKLDELLRATAGAHNALLDLEELEERELDQIRAGYARLAEHARTDLQRGETDSGVPEVG